MRAGRAGKRMATTRSPWGGTAPSAPRVGSGRAALAKRAKARGGKERRAATAAARRALNRGSGNRRSRRGAGEGRLIRPVRGAWNELVRQGRSAQQRFLVRQRLRPILLALAAAWVLWTFLLGDASLFRLWSVRHENSDLTSEIRQLESRDTRVRDDVRALRSGDEPELIERLAREEHAMVRDGETLVRFVPAEP